MTIMHAVRSKDGRWTKVNNLSSAVATATLNGRTGLDHEIASINDQTQEASIVRVPAPRVRHPAGNQVFRSTSRGKWAMHFGHDLLKGLLTV